MRARPSPALSGSLRNNVSVLHVLRGEAAWRNLLNLQMALGRYARAEIVVDAKLAKRPGQRTALLRQFRPEAEWENFVKTRALASPDMQLVYGELLLERGRWGIRNGTTRGWRRVSYASSLSSTRSRGS